LKKIIFIILIFLFLPHSEVKACEDPVAGISIVLNNLEQIQAEIQRDVPMPFIYQVYTFSVCQDYKVDYEMALAVMDGECNGEISAFNRNDNGSVDKGIMQINSCNYSWLKEELGVTDFYNPWQNIRCGVFILGGLSSRYTDQHQILMSYNMGERRMRKLRNEGIYSSEYSRKIIRRIKEISQEKENSEYLGNGICFSASNLSDIHPDHRIAFFI
jgi:hypothetical protein